MPRIPDPLARSLMLENGEIDLAGFAGLTPQAADRLEDEDHLTVTTEGYGAIGYVHYLELNLREAPFAGLHPALKANCIRTLMSSREATV